MNFELMANSFPLLLAGAAITVEITAMSVTFGLLIGCMIGIARLCSIKPLRYFANVYVDFIRGTPLLVQIFLVYFALPNIIGSRVDPFVAAISACSIKAVRMLPKSSVQAFSLSTRARWKQAAALA